MDEMTHDRCSELLGSYVRGELPPEEARAVAAHLAGCGECRVEERAVAALGAAPDVDALTDVERARLHRGLAQELFKPRANADVAGVAPVAQRWSRWAAPALASAAVIAAIVVVTTGGGGSDETAGLSAPAVEEPNGTEDALEAEAGTGGGGAGRGTRARADDSKPLGAKAEQGEFDMASGGPQPAFYEDFGDLSRSALVDLGNFRSFAGAYSPEDAPGLYGPFLDRIKKEAAGARPEVDECAATIPQDGKLIPVYGVAGEYDDRDALALGYVTSDPDSDELNRYLIWVWARDDCGHPIDTFFEKIDSP